MAFIEGIPMNRYYIYYGIAAMLLLEAFILYFKKC